MKTFIMGQSSKYIEELYNETIKIDEKEYNSLNERCHCTCLICGYKWQPKFGDLKYGRGCSQCSKEKILQRNKDERLRRCKEKAVEYGLIHNIEIKNVYEKGKSIIVAGINHNYDKAGNEYGEFKQNYYSFLKGSKIKKEIGDNLRYSTEDWIKKAKEIHPEYLYEKTKYINNRTPIIITCPIHGNFSVMPKIFLKKDYKCNKCKIEGKDNSIYIEILKKKFPELDFSQSVYKNKKSKIKVICPIHGEFMMIYRTLLNGKGCPKCSKIKHGNDRRKSTESFIEEAKKIHGNKYDYIKTNYVISNDKVCIICHNKDKFGKEHGEFWQLPNSHLRGQGCPVCTNRQGKNNEDFIKESIAIHGNKYDYSKVDYKNTHTKVCIICPEHGEFWQSPHNHLQGYGCSKCSGNYLDKELFIRRAKEIHGNKYDYSKVDYQGNKKKVCIICQEHGEFWQIPNSHLNGRGCPICKTSHIEREFKKFLDENNIEYLYQYHNNLILGQQSFDFYIPNKKIAIECQGEEHYCSNFYKSKLKEDAESAFIYRRSLDERKRKICKDNNIELVYFLDKSLLKYKDSDNLYFTNKEELLNYINNYENK